jgi:hypothetical protein
VNEIEAPSVEEVDLQTQEPIANAYITIDLENGDDTVGNFTFNKDLKFVRPFKTTAAAHGCAQTLRLMVGDMISIKFSFVVTGRIG